MPISDREAAADVRAGTTITPSRSLSGRGRTLKRSRSASAASSATTVAHVGSVRSSPIAIRTVISSAMTSAISASPPCSVAG